MFVGRKEELKYLKEEYRGESFKNVIIYGRRRIGKTTLCTEFAQDRPSTYFLSQKTPNQAQKLADKFAKENNIYPKKTETFEEAFEFIKNSIKERYIIILDEFPYLIEEDRTIPSQFQYIIDEILKDSKIFLIILGSSIAMMENEVLSHKSPLFGRRTGQIKLQQLKIEELVEFFPNKTMEQIIEIYGVFDSIPAYLKKIDSSKNIYENIKQNLLIKESYLFEEPEFLLKQELREPKKYTEILRAIANGKTRLSEIANETQIPANILTKYISSLITLEIIHKKIPITEKELSRNTLYDFKDNFLRFYYRFIYNNISAIEERRSEQILDEIKNEFSTYLGKIFEDVCQKFLLKSKSFEKVGTYWKKNIEIDLVGINKNKITLIECKYRSVNYNEILKKLKNKEVPFKNPDYLIIAKKFTSKDKGISLGDMSKSFKENNL